jgi:hypothetical protein
MINMFRGGMDEHGTSALSSYGRLTEETQSIWRKICAMIFSPLKISHRES